YATGKGVEKNEAEAAKWYRLAADQGHAIAQSMLGSMYNIGLGVPHDRVLAYMWTSLAEAQGDQKAAKRLKDMAAKMTPTQIAKAQKMAREWRAKYLDRGDVEPNRA